MEDKRKMFLLEKLRKIFISTTLRKAKEEIKKIEEARGEKLTEEAKDKIIQRCAKKARRKAAALGVAAFLGINNLLTGCAALPEGENNVTTTTTYKESLKVEVPNQTAPEKEEDKILAQVQSEIAMLDSQEDVLNYWKQLYTEKYKEVTGESISATDINLSLTKQSYVYQLENGQIVTHGANPAITQSKIEADGIKYKIIPEEVYVYFVTDKDNNVIDAMGAHWQTIIPGDNYDLYDEKKQVEEESTLVALGGNVTNRANTLINAFRDYEENKNDILKKSVLEQARSRFAEAVGGLKTAPKQQKTTSDHTR